MAYATLQALCEQYGYLEVSQLLSDEEGLVTEDLLRDAIEESPLTAYSADEQAAIAAALARALAVLQRQAGLIDTKLAVRYQLPLSLPVINNSPLVDCELALTRASLADDGDNVAKHILEERKRWLTWLDDLAADKAVLPGAAKVEKGGNTHQRLTTQPVGLDFTDY